MATNAKCGTFATTTGTSQVAVSGVGFQPTVVLFWGGRQTAEGSTAPLSMGFGWAVSSTVRGTIFAGTRDNVATNITRNQLRTDACFGLENSDSSAVDGMLDFVSMDSDGFTVVPDDAFTASFLVHYLALGGDLNQAVCGNTTAGTTNGNYSVTGLAFQPELVIVATANHDRAAVNTEVTELSFNLGFGMSSSARMCVGFGSDSGSSGTNSRRILSDNMFLREVLYDSDGLRFSLDFVSMNSDGFTWSKTNVTGSSDTPMLYLALAGGDFKLLSYALQTSTGNFGATGAGFKPAGMLTLGTFSGAATQTSVTTGAELCVGAATATNARGCVTGLEDDGVTNTDSITYLETDHVVENIQRDAADTYSVTSSADFVSFDSDGFTLNQDDADATAHLCIAVLFGPAAAAGGTPKNRNLIGSGDSLMARGGGLIG